MDGKRKNMLEIIFKAREEKLASLNMDMYQILLVVMELN